MIRNHQSFKLHDQMLVEKGTIQPPFRVSYAMSNRACFIYMIDGCMRSSAEDGQATLYRQDAVLMKCGIHLADLVPDETNAPCEILAFHLNPELLQKVYHNEPPEFLKSAHANHSTAMSQSIRADDALKAYIDSILIYFEDHTLVSEELLALKLKELLSLLMKTHYGQPIQNILSSLFSPRRFQFQEVIEAHSYSQIDLDGLAKLTNLSLSTFKRRFQEFYGESPASFLKTRKLKRAAERLQHSDENVSIIAYDCGFENPAYFATAFGNEYGMPPSDFRLNYSKKTLS